MSQNIDFPKINVPILSANQPIANNPQKVLFVGQANSFPASAELTENIPNSPTEINALFGEGSVLALMLIAAREINKLTQFDAISLPTSAGSFAAGTATLTYTGPATEAGNIEVTLGSSRDGKVSIAVADTDADTVIAASVVTAINATDGVGQRLGFTANATLGVVTITSDNTGNVGGDVSLSATDPVAGVAVAVVGFATLGTQAEDPLATGWDDPIQNQRYQTVVWPYIDIASAELNPVMDARFNVQDDVLDGVGIVINVDTFAAINTDLGSNFNSQSVVYLAQLIETFAKEESSGIFELSPRIISQFAAIRALRLETGANIASLTISRSGSLDSIGGPALASKPYANTPMKLLPKVPTGRGWDKSEIALIVADGGSVLGNNRANDSITMGQIVTTYLTDAASDPDGSFKFLNYVDTASVGREYFFNNLGARFAQTRLTDGNLIQGREITNKENIRAVMTGFFNDLTGPDFVIARAGEDNLNFFKDNLSVTTDLLTGTANITFALPIVTQLRIINAPMQLTFDIE